MSEDTKKLWYEIPSYVFVALARRGMEKISLDQCFLPDCDNNSKDLLEPIKKEEYEEDDKHVKIIHMKCHRCKGTFQFKLETLKRVAKPTKSSKKSKKDDEEQEALTMGLAYALDENGKDLGHIGYF
ncbi:MAG: hypothetical protein GF317_03430 [Candidatus Lokiarchaeota archaeon]|nr:hypothetical protein [Candidatus Lokiarchaeota archaeon]MBD3198948.1 hypothetical protein [Candidatus Lokiarchaeota archaeon]